MCLSQGHDKCSVAKQFTFNLYVANLKLFSHGNITIGFFFEEKTNTKKQ